MPPMYWWKYEMIDRMKQVTASWATKMMSELEKVDHALSEPYQREVQFIVDSYKQ